MAKVPELAPREGGSGDEPITVVGRYAIFDAVAAGGMATVHLGRLIGEAGFLRTVAIKRLHSQYAKDPEFTSMFLDEARLAARVQHPNVVPTIDVVVDGNELLLVMEYVRGISLSQLTRAARERNLRLPPKVVASIISGMLRGLHAAHEASDEKGMPLELVHRDVSPQNVLVGVDGTPRVLDFGIAKAAGRIHTTRDGEIKGKLLYMSPEQLAAEPLTRATDIYAAGIVLFESLTNVRMFAGEQEAAAISKIIKNMLRLPSSIDPELAAFDPIVRRASAGEVGDRYPTAYEMADAIERASPLATPNEVGEWVKSLGVTLLDQRAQMVAHVERSSTRSKPPPPSARSTGGMPTAAQLSEQMSAPLSSGSMRGAPNTLSPSSGSLRAAANASVKASGTFTSKTARDAIDAAADGGATSILTEPELEEPSAGFAPAQAQGSRTFVALVVGILLALLAVAITAIVFLLAYTTPNASPTASTPATTTTTALVTTTATTAAATTSAAATTTTTTTAPAAAPSTTASTSPAVAAASSPPSPAVVKPVVNVVRPKISCDPPYTVDKKGHRHFIPECNP